jgi:hypothetical protein
MCDNSRVERPKRSKLGHHDDVAGLEPRHQLGQLRPVGANAADNDESA